MAAGAINRALIGDPALKPFVASEAPGDEVIVENDGGGLTVTVAWSAGFHPMAWNIYTRGRMETGRMYARVDIADLWPGTSPVADVTVQLTTGEDTVVKAQPKWALEEFYGRRFIHLQPGAPSSASPTSPQERPAAEAADAPAAAPVAETMSPMQLLNLGLIASQVDADIDPEVAASYRLASRFGTRVLTAQSRVSTLIAHALDLGRSHSACRIDARERARAAAPPLGSSR